jgi:hypothetical protein
MLQSHVSEGKLDRDAVAGSLRKWLDAVLPATRLALGHEIRTNEQTAGAGADAEFEHPEVVA